MKNHHLFGLFFLIFMGIASLPCADAKSQAIYGMTADAGISQADMEAYKLKGGKVLRISFANFPLVERTSPYQVLSSNLKHLDDLIIVARRVGLQLILDPHSMPGTKSPYTTTPNDELWTSTSAQSAIVRLWAVLATRYRNDGDVLIAYDVLNEPSIDLRAQFRRLKRDWNSLALEIVKEIRKVDADRVVIIEPCTGFDANGNWINRLEGMRYLSYINDPNVVYSPHYYLPKEFTHQGVFGEFPPGVSYPGKIEGVYWDKNELRRRLEPVISFEKKYAARIYIGEFGVSCWAENGSDTYIMDLISLFDELGWGWSYHSFRESFIWSAEMRDGRCMRASAKAAAATTVDLKRADYIFDRLKANIRR